MHQSQQERTWSVLNIFVVITGQVYYDSLRRHGDHSPLAVPLSGS
jgi:hypothetical protein